jgi:MYXO-CTERM domain-containing protein
MNGVPIVAGDPVMEQWAALLACRYNGCCTTSATCKTRAQGYRDNAITAYTDQGGEFWHTSDRCAALPADGVIDQRSTCYVAAGDPRYWRRETIGYAASLEWTYTTDSAAPANFAEWLVHAPAGRYHVDVHLDGGMFGRAKQAKYQIAHAGAVDTVTVDQTSASGFVTLGEFEFAGTGDEHVLLGNNTGEPAATNTKIAFDAVRVLPLDGPMEPAPSAGCGCATDGGADASIAIVIAAGLRAGRRRRPARPVAGRSMSG